MFKKGDTIKITDSEVFEYNVKRLFKITNKKPYKDNDLFVKIANEFEEGTINKRCIERYRES